MLTLLSEIYYGEKIESFPWISTGKIFKAIFILTMPARSSSFHCLNAIHFYHTVIVTDNWQSSKIFFRLRILSGNERDLTIT